MLGAATMLSLALYMLGAVAEDAASAYGWDPLSLAIGMTPVISSMLWLHTCVVLTDTRFKAQPYLLAFGYVAVTSVAVIGSTSNLIYNYTSIDYVTKREVSASFLGPLFPLHNASILIPLLVALVMLALAERRRRVTSNTPSFLLFIVGTGLFLLGGSLTMLNAHSGFPLSEAPLQLVIAAGALVLTYPLARHPGLLEAQLLWGDLRSSLLGTTVALGCFVGLAIAAGGTDYTLSAAGWLVVVAYVFNGRLRALADRPFFGATARADRADLLTAARFVGGPSTLELSALSDNQAGSLVGLVSHVERAGMAWERLRFERDLWMELLAEDEFAGVRRALGVPHDWSPRHAFPVQQVRERVEGMLTPRERLVVGLKYLGYSDHDMAEMMDVRENVPRGYLSSAKAKLGLPAGAALTLYAHFSGVVPADALPQVRVRRGLAKERDGAAGLPLAGVADEDDA